MPVLCNWTVSAGPVRLAHEMEAFAPLSRKFFEPSAEEVAPRLLGRYLVRNTSAGFCAGMIVETEAYLVGDAACHGAPGPTARNRVMFGPPGYAYVYLIYGFHFCVNAVCQPAGVAEAVLIRAVEPVLGVALMQQRRHADNVKSLTNGPGKLCQAMDITRKLDGADLCDPGSELFVAENPALKKTLKAQGPLITTTRVGITKAAGLPLRFYLAGSSFVSRKERLRTPEV